jgi:hypothetical protein
MNKSKENIEQPIDVKKNAEPITDPQKASLAILDQAWIEQSMRNMDRMAVDEEYRKEITKKLF